MPYITKKHLILQVAVPSPLRHTFDYLPPNDCALIKIEPGMRILVPFGRREIIGVILEVTNESKLDLNKLKPAIAILDDKPILSKSIIELIIWTSSYYHHPIGDVINNALPNLLREKIRKKKLDNELKKNDLVNQSKLSDHKTIQLNKHQKQAIDTIKNHINKFKAFLLDGVTGSGKTEVYLRIIAEVIAANKQALVLVPEINLTPQTIARFAERFSVNIAVFHSRLTPKERLLAWLMAKDGVASIIIGTRSAIFTPLKNPGIIIIDEEHDLSFKQQSGLKYSARNLAIVRSKLENIPIILGTATPCLESIYNVKNKRYIELLLPERAGIAIHPSFHLVDMRNQKMKNGIAENLLHPIKKHLANNGQVLIFLNRRGFAPVLICHHCGWTSGCKYCDARLTLHQKKHHLCCHHCNVIEKIPTKCPKCNNDNLLSLGSGTERVEETLSELLPEAKLVRIDRDTTKKKNSLEEMLKNIHNKEYQILIGTQMIAKGHHFPDVTMVAILNVDQGLFSSDFRSSEYLAQIIMQVSGRAGRSEKPGEVYLQTHNPEHPLLLSLISGGYKSFVDNCLKERHAAKLPPYSYLALLNAESKTQEAALKFLKQVRTHIEKFITNSVKLFGPIPAIMERKAGYFRAQLLLQSQNRETLQQSLDILLNIIDELKPKSSIKWSLDVDPVEL